MTIKISFPLTGEAAREVQKAFERLAAEYQAKQQAAEPGLRTGNAAYWGYFQWLFEREAKKIGRQLSGGTE